MNKILRLTMAAALALVSTFTFAQTTVTFTAGTDKGADGGSAAKDVSLTKDGITIHATNESGNAGVLGRNDNYRFYQNSTLEVSSTVGNITKVVFNCTASGDAKYGPGCFTDPSTGTYTVDDKVGTWTGNAASFTLTASKAQVRATSIEVTYTAGGSTDPTTLAAPTISGDETFAESTTVTITADEGATVYYTTNGQDPDDREGIQYTQPFTLDATTTVKAIAYKGDLQSSVAEKTFTKQATTDATIASLNESTENASNVNLKLTNAKVVYVNGDNAHVREGGKAVMFYRTGLTFKQNQIVNGTVNVDYQYFYGIPEVKKNDNTSADNLTLTDGADETTLDATAATIADIKANKYVADLVKIEGVSIVSKGDNQYATNGTDSVQLYKNVADITSYVGDGKTHTVYALFNNIFRGNQEVSVVAVDATQEQPTEDKTAENIAAFNALDKGTAAVLTLNNAQVVYTWTSNGGNTSTYVRDASGALDFFNTGLDLKANDVLNGTVNLTRDEYNNLIEAVKNDNTNADNLTITAGEAAQPKVITVAEAASNISDLVVLNGVNITKDGRNFYIVDGENKVQVYNGFHLDGCDPAEAENVSITGILVQYRSTVEIYPIAAPVATGINSIKADTNTLDVNAPMYNLAGQRVNKDFKGVVIQNGRKVILK